MSFILTLILVISAIYCLGAYGYLAYRTFRYGENWENETFHLGLCLILAVGFLLLANAQLGAVDNLIDSLHPIQSSSN
jgi:hypothetical protein